MADKPFSNPSSMTEQLQNLCWRLATEMRAVYNTVAQKLTKADADTYYLGKTAKAAAATTADSATKATQDGNGNVISSTYAKNTSIPTKVSQLANDSGYITSSPLSGYLPLTGGTLTGALTVKGRVSGTQLTAKNTSNTNLDFFDSNCEKGGGWILPSASHTAGNWTEIWTKVSLSKLSQLTNDSGYITDWGVKGSENASIEFRTSSSQTHGGFIDFHFKGSTTDFTSRIIESASGKLAITAANGLTLNGNNVLTSHQSLASCYKVSGGALNDNAIISRKTSGTSWIAGRDHTLIKNTTAPGSSWGPITSSKTTNGSWETGALSDNFYIVYSSDTNYNAGTNTVKFALTVSPNGNVAIGGTSLTVGGKAVLTSHQSLAGYAKVTSSTADLTAGSSALATGQIYLVYE